jgi:molybdate transport system permease protein
MLGGNIPHKTKTISIAIYDYVELLEYGKAHTLSLILIIFCLMSLVFLFVFGGKQNDADDWN